MASMYIEGSGWSALAAHAVSAVGTILARRIVAA
ncbi:MAG: hypothetical protein K0R20_477 [Actinomycetia bacterium]|jgi:hypothetical protein|nr:hypothetical protein [Actinomycetes bacterium]